MTLVTSGRPLKTDSSESYYHSLQITPLAFNRRTALGVIWTHSAYLTVKVVGFLSTIVLARLLLPQEFGLVAIGFIVLAFLENLSEAGAAAAVVWHKAEPHHIAAVALTVTIISSTIVGSATYLAAPMIADFFEEPRTVSILRVLSVSFILSSPVLVFSSLLQRCFAFRRKVLPEIAKAVTKGVVGIGLALHGFGVWSLVIGHLAGLGVALCLFWALSGWRPYLSLDRRILRAILPYGVQIVLIGLIGMGVKNADYLVIGRFFGAKELGLYFLAFSVVDQLVMGICWAASQVLFPSFSSIESNPTALRQAYKDSLAGIAAIVLPVALGIAMIGDPFVAATFGAKWQEIVPVMQALAVYAIVYSFGFNLGDIYKATGKPYILIYIGLASFLITVPILIVAVQGGIVGVALGQVCAAGFITALNWTVAARVLGIRPGVYWCALKGPVIASAIMVTCCAVVRVVTPVESNVFLIVLIVLTGLISYGLALCFTAPNLIGAAAHLLIAEKKTVRQVLGE